MEPSTLKFGNCKIGFGPWVKPFLDNCNSALMSNLDVVDGVVQGPLLLVDELTGKNLQKFGKYLGSAHH